MIRGIKFRAKNVHDGKWYYSDSLGMILFWQQIEQGHLDISTFGQHTGLKDKNRVEIYENDIADRIGTNSIGAIMWMKMEGCFAVCYSVKSTVYHDYLDEYDIDTVEGRANGLEIIGNIHDNPKLLEGSK